jgi:hypothetical protein
VIIKLTSGFHQCEDLCIAKSCSQSYDNIMYNNNKGIPVLRF